MRYLLLAALVPAALCAQAGDTGPAHPISLNEAIRLARQNSPTTIQARNSVSSQDLAVRAAYMTFLPNLSYSAGGSWSKGTVIDPQGNLKPYISATPWSFNRGWSTSLTLFDAGKRLFDLESVKASRSSAEASERAAQYSVALNVSTQYYAALAARESRAAAQAQLDEAEANLRSAVARIAAGAATRSDSLRAVISLGNARLAILQADNNLANANAALTRLVATPFTVTPTPEDSMATAEAFAVDSAQLMASIQQAPTVVSATMSLTAARSSVRAARTSYFPSLSMSYGSSGRNNSSNFDFGQGAMATSTSFSLRFSLNLWDGFSRENNVQNASLQEINARAQLRDASLLAQQNMLQYLNQLRVSQTQIMINQASLEAAQEDLRVQQQRYSLGASTQLELLTTQQALNAARYSLVSARFNARNALVQIEALLGRDIR